MEPRPIKVEDFGKRLVISDMYGQIRVEGSGTDSYRRSPEALNSSSFSTRFSTLHAPKRNVNSDPFRI